MEETFKALIIEPNKQPRYVDAPRSIAAIKELIGSNDIDSIREGIKVAEYDYRTLTFLFAEIETPMQRADYSVTVVQDWLNINTLFGTVLVCGQEGGTLADVPATIEEIKRSKKVLWKGCVI